MTDKGTPTPSEEAISNHDHSSSDQALGDAITFLRAPGEIKVMGTVRAPLQLGLDYWAIYLSRTLIDPETGERTKLKHRFSSALATGLSGWITEGTLLGREDEAFQRVTLGFNTLQRELAKFINLSDLAQSGATNS